MSITFENDNVVIIYGLENIIAFAERQPYIFAAQCVWWLASIIGLKQEMIVHIDHLLQRKNLEFLTDHSGRVHPDGAQQILFDRAVSLIPRDLMEDRRLGQILESAENGLEESERARNTWQ